MSTASLWIEECPKADQYPQLETDLETEVCVIGGGITGVMTAYYLAKDKRKVVLIEKDKLGHGETGYTTAFVTAVTDATLRELKQTFGHEKAALAWMSGVEILNEIERIIREEEIDCEFTRCPVKIYAASERDAADLREEVELANRLGFTMRMHEATEHFPWGYASMENQAKFHPRKFLLALAKKAVEYGAKIYENSPVLEFTGKEGNAVKTKFGTVIAHEIVEATHATIAEPIEVPSRLESFQSYVIETKVKNGIFPEGIYWDTEDPYHYFRIDPKDGYDRLILGGEDHRSGEEKNPNIHFEKLEEYLRWLLKEESFTTVRRWSGQILETPDGLPFIGRSLTNRHHLIATGYAGNGMTFGAIAAKTISDIVSERANAWIELYTPIRFKKPTSFLRSGLNYIKEMIVGRLKERPFDTSSIAPGGGAVVLLNNKKVAVSKDDDGSVMMVSAVCTHLGCVVGWNAAERTWDCPCHGSRYRRDGEVLNGPAKSPLQKIK